MIWIGNLYESPFSGIIGDAKILACTTGGEWESAVPNSVSFHQTPFFRDYLPNDQKLMGVLN